MSLRGKQPEAVDKRLKMLLFGAAGSGKSTACLGFPAPYVIDCERGIEHAQYLNKLKKNGGALFQTSSYDELMNEVKTLLTEKHTYKTLVIDPLTTIYNELVDQGAVKGDEATAFGRHYQAANLKMKRLLQLLTRLDMSLIITSHAKNEYGQNMSVIGSTFDCFKKLDYLFDLVIEIKKLGRTRTGIVRKTRIATFDEYEEFEFSYEAVAAKYNRDIMEKEAVSEVLATPEQLKEIKRLTALLKTPAETIERWCSKANCESLDEMNSDTLAKCIVHLQEQINGKESK